MRERERYIEKSAVDEEMTDLCRDVKRMVKEGQWSKVLELIPRYMEIYPDSAVPHNLMGIVLESRGQHPEAMRHFRAAWALDSTYLPATHNMDAFAVCDSKDKREPAYTTADCKLEG